MADETRPTLTAVSGGADSAALAIALGTLDGARIVLGHVVHDQRPSELAHDDRAAVAALGRRLGIRVVCGHARSGEGNCEHAARKVRYELLDRMAKSLGCAYIATAHHAYDQAETLLMAMTRGASPDALLGIRSSRPSSSNSAITVIRPALKLPPQDAACVCSDYGYHARIDATNLDPARARTQLRRRVVPELNVYADDLGEMLARTVGRLRRRLGDSFESGSDVGLESVDT